MPTPIPLRRELLLSFAVLFAAAVLLAVAGVLVILPLLPFASPLAAAAFISILVIGDLSVMFWFGHRMLRDRFVHPMETLTEGVRRIAGGEYGYRAAGAESHEMRELESSVNAMADALIREQGLLARNIESLDRSNSELIEARNQVIQAARLASVGTLGAGIAHEVGNPLGAIIGYVDVARARVERAGGDTEMLDAIRVEANRIDRIVRSLLDYARPRQEESTAVAPRGVIERVRELLEAQGKLDDVRHEWHFEDAVPRVIVVAHRLEQVLVNLLLNAIDALEGKRDAHIVVSLSVDSPEVARLPFRREGDPLGINYMHRRRVSRDEGGRGVDPLFTAARVVVLTIDDNGPGIPEENRERVFDPFFTTKEPGKGTGLGLSICGRLVEGMGGRIHAGRSPEGGARFTIRLPGATLEPGEVERVWQATTASEKTAQ